MDLIIPAYNIDPKVAAKYEGQIAKVMHKKREEEINRFRDSKLPPKAGRTAPLAGEGKLPDNDTRKTAITKGRANTPTDELILKLLSFEELAISQVADRLGISRQLARHAIERLRGRGSLARRYSGSLTVWRTAGE